MSDTLTQIARQLAELSERIERLEAIEHPYHTPGSKAVIVGGEDGVASGARAATLGGFDNQATAENSVIVGGASAINSAAEGFIGGGNGNEITSAGLQSAILGGLNNQISNIYGAIFAGDGNIVSAIHGVALGLYASSYLRGQLAMAQGRFAATGDAQASQIVLRAATTDATPTNLVLNSGSNRPVLPTNTAWHCWVEIIARKSGGGDHAAFVRRCVIERTVNATALVGSVQTIGTDIASGGAGAWAVAITADDTNEALQVQVTGQASTNIRWVAWVRMVEVGYS